MDCINKIEEYTSGVSFAEFDKNQLLIDAVIRNLEVIGEAAKYIPQDIREQYSLIPWKNIIGLRNILIHEYFGIDERIVWEVVTVDLMNIKPLLEQLIRELQ
ncbi:HepT-like ribonuclease domain-containing protein [Salibacterium aidingense]|uniref:HepT-like ribonuclease domain-containing protein n=1 Tax=Salibacterium aidingense TaxID=384933 RepID=UPI003BDEBD91